MNRKQTVLTICALIAFVVIGLAHYLAWPPIEFYSTEWTSETHWEKLTIGEAKTKYRGQYLDLFFPQKPAFTYEQAMGKAPLTEEQLAGPKEWVPIETDVAKSVWNPHMNGVTAQTYAMVPDVRMPWFMLGVIYVGLFFVLADRKPR